MPSANGDLKKRIEELEKAVFGRTADKQKAVDEYREEKHKTKAWNKANPHDQKPLPTPPL